MADPQRARKLADRIKEIVARRLDKGLRDPRLGFVTITDVRVTGDLQHASIFYTVYGTEEERRDSALALKAATGMLRSEVGRNITSRLTPTPSGSTPPERASGPVCLACRSTAEGSISRPRAYAATVATSRRKRTPTFLKILAASVFRRFEGPSSSPTRPTALRSR